MSVLDVSGGLDAAYEYGLRDHPRIAYMREGVSVWVYDDAGRLGFPRVALEGVGPDWDPKRLQVTVAYPDGRVLLFHGPGAGGEAEDEHGMLSVFSGGPLELRCLEPFTRWSVRFDGEMVETSCAEQIADRVDLARRVPVAFEIETTMAVPPWVTGTMTAAADERLASGDAVFVGGRRSADAAMRYEQLFRARGVLRVGGGDTSFTGSGLRIHRQGLRNLQGFTGHVWQSGLFPDGRGFGYMWLLPNDFKEGFLYADGRMIPARIVKAPFMSRMVNSGEDLSLVFESELGRTVIEGESVLSSFIPASQPFSTEGSYGLNWHQGGVRYRWDGEETYGMIERSSLPEAMEA
jgi:hypothetical protein